MLAGLVQYFWVCAPVTQPPLLIGVFDQTNDDSSDYGLISKQLLKVVTDTVVTTTTTTTVEEKYKVTNHVRIIFIPINHECSFRCWHQSQCKRHSCQIPRTKEVFSINVISWDRILSSFKESSLFDITNERKDLLSRFPSYASTSIILITFTSL